MCFIVFLFLLWRLNNKLNHTQNGYQLIYSTQNVQSTILAAMAITVQFSYCHIGQSKCHRLNGCCIPSYLTIFGWMNLKWKSITTTSNIFIFWFKDFYSSGKFVLRAQLDEPMDLSMTIPSWRWGDIGQYLTKKTHDEMSTLSWQNFEYLFPILLP